MRYTDYLFARPSFLEGVGRLFDVAGALNEYNIVPPREVANARALLADWMAVAADFRSAVAQFDPHAASEPTGGETN